MSESNKDLNITESQKKDNRMGFIRLLESEELREYVAEYEFASECKITGELKYSNGNLILRLLTTEFNRDGLLKYTLALKAPAEYKLFKYKSSKEGYYFQGSEADEILSLASLYLRSRFFPVARIFRDLNSPPLTKWEYDFRYVRPNKSADKPVFDSSKRSFNSLDTFLKN